MSHKLIAKLGRFGTVEWEALCTEPKGAECRLVCEEGCESWSSVLYDEDGPYHHQDLFDYFEHKKLVGDGPKHRMVDSGNCNVCLWLNDDPSLIPELHEGLETFTLAEFAINTRFNGDETVWTRRES